jgi:hypothetical protein
MSSINDPRIKFLERLKLKLKGYVYIGEKQIDGHKDSLSYYAFECPIHGLVSDFPHGYRQRLECPTCKSELVNNKRHNSTKIIR